MNSQVSNLDADGVMERLERSYPISKFLNVKLDVEQGA